ncbi:LLM class flavin-dependent oxidoreductase [Arthrobacter cheniae]|uniref:LLM class flavin-dependent oxidoreductase n=1 Tax=Arthrobacter cheniae TaxID=1258888 RepID=A0A3A5MBJ4_9MICC|nr:LLM class flavin-dependent oxidoreductase [Arthrobacter cheniae]RJT77953.1 LLM class flavin-dependent oxidoreductase [Arthrobacter cheniae]
MRLSVLDQSPVAAGLRPAEALRETIRLARATEAMGYHRFWVAEHHASPGFAGTTPELLAMAVLDATGRMRVGTGGVLLAQHDPRRISESFDILAALHPGRVDLGVGRAGTADPDMFTDKLVQLHKSLHLMPDDESRTDLNFWLLGAGRGSAPLAATLGAGYAHAHFLNATSGRPAILQYASTFAPTNHRAHPEGLGAVRVITAPTSDEADRLADSVRLWRARKDLGLDQPFPNCTDSVISGWSEQELSHRADHDQRMIVGEPVTVVKQLKRLSRQMGVDELMISTPLPRFDDRIRSFELIEQAMHEVFTSGIDSYTSSGRTALTSESTSNL